MTAFKGASHRKSEYEVGQEARRAKAKTFGLPEAWEERAASGSKRREARVISYLLLRRLCERPMIAPMPTITLKQWAKRNNVSRRTAETESLKVTVPPSEPIQAATSIRHGAWRGQYGERAL